MGVLGAALAYKWYIDGVEALGAGRAVQFNNLLPVFTVAQSMILLHERPSWASFAGGAMVLVGLLVAQTSRQREPNLNATAMAEST
jgi:drug/metabolite transporter (DMT)-like permease